MSGSDVNGISGLFPFRIPGATEVEAVPGKEAPAGGKGLPVAVRQELENVASELVRASRTLGGAIRFQVDLDAGQAVIHVLDRDTGEVIRRIPMEKPSERLTRFVATHGAFDLRLHDDIA